MCVLPTACISGLVTKHDSRKRRDYFAVLLCPGGFTSGYLRKEVHFITTELSEQSFLEVGLFCVWGACKVHFQSKS